MNKNRQIEIWVGLFMAAGLAALFFLAMQVSNLGNAYTGDTFQVNARFDNIGGLKVKAPVTLAGTIVTHNAEVLGGLTLNQLVRKGAPVIYGSSTTAMDLKIAAASVGTPECAVISGAVARLARYYALPSYVAGG